MTPPKMKAPRKKGEGSRQSLPARPPTSAMPMVAAKAWRSIGGNQTMGGISMPDVSTHILATSAAVIDTKMTRRYCMKATSRWSAPKAPAISTMAVAAPGEEPQTAVVPGRMRQRLISQPSRLEAATVAITTPRNSGHSA